MTNSGFEEIRREVDRFVPLFGVAYVVEPAPISTKYAPIYCCRLDLGGVALFVCATEEDTIGVTRNLPEAFVNCHVVDAAAKPPWSVAIGLPIRWAWEMRNNYGSPDGLQIEFSHPDHGGLAMVQFVASASALSIRTVREIHARGGARAAAARGAGARHRRGAGARHRQ